MHIFTLCTENYKDAIDLMVPSWVVQDSVEAVYIYTDFACDFPHKKVHILNQIEKTTDWVKIVGLKPIILKDFLHNVDCKQFCFLDIDCYVTGDISDVFNNSFDIAIARMFQKKISANAGVWFCNTSERIKQFATEWVDLSNTYYHKKIGIKRYNPAYEQISLSDILHREHKNKTYLTVLPLDSNIYNNDATSKTRWFKSVSRYKPKILHFKKRFWRDSNLYTTILSNYPKQVILSTYFTTKKDPVYGVYQPSDNYDKIKDWMTTLSDLKLNGIIFYDNLSDWFIKKYTNEYIQFKPYELKTTWSLNDERYLCYKQFLDVNPQYTQLFMTDLFDVTFHKNPFELFNSQYKLYVGSAAMGRNKIRQYKWLKQQMQKLLLNPNKYNSKLAVNAGVLGGKRDDVLLFLNKLLIQFIIIHERIPDCFNINMAVFHTVLHDTFQNNQILNKSPLVSRFKKNQQHGDFAIKHK